MWIILGIGFAVLVVVGVVFLLLRRKKDERIESVVMLRRGKRGLTEVEVRGAARRALKLEVEVISVPHPDGLTNCFGIVVEGMPALYVIDSGRMYGDDAEEESNRFENADARNAYRAHTAWLSVDLPTALLKAAGETGARAMRLMMAKLACELYDDGCIMLYAPAMGRVALPTPEVEAQLKAGDLSSLFGNEDVNLPVFYTEGDGKVEKAVARAKKEWPTFVEVWGRRGASCEGIVKGAFQHADGREHMWVEVTRVHDGKVTGILMNDPVHVKVKKGQEVTVAAPQDISDWACIDGEKPVGMFVERVLRGG